MKTIGKIILIVVITLIAYTLISFVFACLENPNIINSANF